MKLQRTSKYNPELFNLIPLINVLFLSLAFATLGRTFILQPGLSVALPVSPFTLSLQRHTQIVSITAGALPTIYFQDRRVELKELEAQLAQPGIKERSLIIRADRAVPYEFVSNVMNLGLRQGYSVAVAATSPPQ
jgi:biopolymer transport protein ExbD